MSVQSWTDEFYPVTAVDLVAETMDDVDLLDHSIKKWEGALEENLKKHDVDYDDHALMYDCEKKDYFHFDHTTCSLCEKVKYIDGVNCKKCIIFSKTGSDCLRVWYKSLDDPKPMIELLKQVKTLCLGGGK